MSNMEPWVKFVRDDWFQYHVKKYFKIINELGVDTGQPYTEEQKRAMTNCYFPAHWNMMGQRERDRKDGFSISKEPTVQSYTTHFIDELGRHMEKVAQVFLVCPHCEKTSVTFGINRRTEVSIDIEACEHLQWFSDGKTPIIRNTLEESKDEEE